ncbi:hypothetical protein ACH5RR_024946 [Cinchona calisaya]|uniref:non-specific serine/threonine protein kinase n=1 Tax=Cinchona calisaya TaxID=153742 RepID=A0ABD2Z0S7_9GENT
MTNLYSYLRMSTTITSFILFMSINIPSCYSSNGGDEFRNCSLLMYSCGSLRGIGYPFWGGDRPSYCGSERFRLDCYDSYEDDHYTAISLDNILYRVLGIDPSVPKMTIARDDLWRSICPPYDPSYFFKNSTLSNFNLYSPRTVTAVSIFYGCTSEVISKVQVQSNVTCSINGVTSTGVVFADTSVPGIDGCNISFVVPIEWEAYNDLFHSKITLEQALNKGFDVEYNAALAACSSCESSGGRCGSNSTSDFICFCQDQSYPTLCPKHGNGPWLKPVIGATVAGIGMLTCSVICYCYCKKFAYESMLLLCIRETEDDKKLEAFIKNHESLAPRRYSYYDIKKMTNHLKEKLGEGGYGHVYKGNLFDNRPVAVKILNTSKGNGEEFTNEVASISKTSHVNVVTLLGFCLDGHKRALIYEFMPNGSLEKYIHHESETYLGFKRLYDISIGIARGLEYLHGGCNTRILHFDIKPHNILLDEDFCPKISDFGLAKLCAQKQSAVSMLGARGTIGYIAPEVFSRHFGGVSYKSDVYSYGMMVLEMVGGRRNAINFQLSSSSETYFPHWVYDRIVTDEVEDLKLHGHAMSREENEIARKMILVGLWCIQTHPSHRPTMSKVIDMFQGSLQSLEVPPKPFLSSPSRSEAASLEIAVLQQMISPSSSRSISDSYNTLP